MDACEELGVRLPKAPLEFWGCVKAELPSNVSSRCEKGYGGTGGKGQQEQPRGELFDFLEIRCGSET